ncbi:UNKNOWN [Stylonychia lemnae]|uniref:Uncharacterized protein n=1 Tax=Stylonychia lemnae TaxID=5949 RepID=A0A078A2J2_STYLE|nr:UNKNOWN [Stylonychia lemnae]|eukprot:CDW75758.1 UNKNOWN [Stylonychia lemnae]
MIITAHHNKKDWQLGYSEEGGILFSILLMKQRSDNQNANTKYDGINSRHFVQRISEDEYQRQAKIYTKQQLSELYESEEYMYEMVLKGNNVKEWNWQMKESRTKAELEAEEEYLRNVEQISHQDEVVLNKKLSSAKNIKGNPILSTKESSEKSQEFENNKFFQQNRYYLRSSIQQRESDLDQQY